MSVGIKTCIIIACINDEGKPDMDASFPLYKFSPILLEYVSSLMFYDLTLFIRR